MQSSDTLWRVVPTYQRALSNFARHDRVKSPWVVPVVFSQQAVDQLFPQYSAYVPPAFTVGGVVPSYLELLLGKDYVNRPIGIIAISSDIQQAFNPIERKFIVAHEYSHILMNHWPMVWLGTVGSGIVESTISGIRDQGQRQLAYSIWSVVKQLAVVHFTKQSEVDADIHAVKLIKDRSAALSTIAKLAQRYAGNDLNQPTHYAIVDGAIAGVLTYRERLNRILIGA